MFLYNNKSIEVYLDGPSLEEMKSADKNLVDGFTFNPTLFKKLNVKNYINFSKEILELSSSKPVSLEVFSDEIEETIRQAKILSDLGNNVFVKIPITFTSGASTIEVIKRLTAEGIKLNITAIFTLEQIKGILPAIDKTETILSIFAGRIYDLGVDAKIKVAEISSYVHEHSKCKLLWASPRMSYDLLSAIDTNCDIITIQKNLLAKSYLFEKSPEEYSLDTVKMFFNDAISADYKL